MKSKKVQRGEELVERHHPVVTKPGWLPEGLWPEFWMPAAPSTSGPFSGWRTSNKAQANGDRFRAEDEARIEVYKTGMEDPKMMDPAERERLTTRCARRLRRRARGAG